MSHTFLLDAGLWQVSGTYYDSTGTAYALTGQTRVLKDESVWKLEGFMDVAGKEPLRIANNYDITTSSLPTMFKWRAYNPDIGTLQGRFEIVDDYIMSIYNSEDHKYNGAETMRQKSADTYETVGVSYFNGSKMSAWTATLKAIK